jgi:hypothetical protein
MAFVAGSTGVTAQNNDNPENGKLLSCIEMRRKACKKDPTKNPEFCDSQQATHVFEIGCTIFGTPEEQKANIPTTSWPKL